MGQRHLKKKAQVQKRGPLSAGLGPGGKRAGTLPGFEEEQMLRLRQGQDQRGERSAWAWVQERRRLQTNAPGVVGNSNPSKGLMPGVSEDSGPRSQRGQETLTGPGFRQERRYRPDQKNLRGPQGGLRGQSCVPGSRGMSQGALGRTGVTRGVPGGGGPGRGPEERPRAFWSEVEITGVSHGDVGQTGVLRGFPGDSGQRGTGVPRGVRGALTRRGWRMGEGRPRPT